MKVFFDIAAEESLGKYYENYKYLPTGGTDMLSRSNKYREIVRVLGSIEQCINQTFKRNGKNYIEINGVGTVEYQILEDRSSIMIKNIYFSDNHSSMNDSYKQSKPCITEDVQKYLERFNFIVEYDPKKGGQLHQKSNFRG